jgi:hypothetical protein
VILACPAYAIAGAFERLDHDLAGDLRRLTYSSCATVNLSYRAGEIRRPLPGIGFFVPRGEGLPVLGASFASVKFPERTPRGEILIRCFSAGRFIRGWPSAPARRSRNSPTASCAVCSTSSASLDWRARSASSVRCAIRGRLSVARALDGGASRRSSRARGRGKRRGCRGPARLYPLRRERCGGGFRSGRRGFSAVASRPEPEPVRRSPSRDSGGDLQLPGEYFHGLAAHRDVVIASPGRCRDPRRGDGRARDARSSG